jgi:hypothetical protein
VKRSQRHKAAVALSCAGLSGAIHAQAQEMTAQVVSAEVPPDATRFEFHAPEGCSSAEDFAARVRRRSARIRLVTDAAARRSLVVEIQPPATNGALRGTVTVVEPDGAIRARQLKAKSCEEAIEGLSLIATVTLDPDALLGEPPPEAKPPNPAPKQQPKPRPPTSTAPTRPPVAEPPRYSFGLQAAMLVRVAPEPALGGTAFAAVEMHPARVFSPLVRLSVTHAQRRGLPAKDAEASFAFTLPSVDVCPLRLGPKLVAVRPCAYGSAGVLKVWGGETPQDETHLRFFGAAGASLLVALRVSEALEIVADGRVGMPFRRDHFGVDRVPFFTTPTPGFSTGLGVAGGFQ